MRNTGGISQTGKLVPVPLYPPTNPVHSTFGFGPPIREAGVQSSQLWTLFNCLILIILLRLIQAETLFVFLRRAKIRSGYLQNTITIYRLQRLAWYNKPIISHILLIFTHP